jgi:hypothetical protein
LVGTGVIGHLGGGALFPIRAVDAGAAEDLIYVVRRDVTRAILDLDPELDRGHGSYPTAFDREAHRTAVVASGCRGSIALSLVLSSDCEWIT